jgi:hypothetical protein
LAVSRVAKMILSARKLAWRMAVPQLMSRTVAAGPRYDA